MPIYLGEANTKIILDCGVNITTATTLQINYRTPSGVESYWTAVQETATSISYTTASGDLSEAGTWQVQPYVVTPTWQGYGDKVTFPVETPIA